MMRFRLSPMIKIPGETMSFLLLKKLLPRKVNESERYVRLFFEGSFPKVFEVIEHEQQRLSWIEDLLITDLAKKEHEIAFLPFSSFQDLMKLCIFPLVVVTFLKNFLHL